MPPIPGTLNNPDYERMRREAAEANREAVAAEEMRRGMSPEIGESLRNGEDFIHRVEGMSYEQLRQREIEKKYDGMFGRVKAFFAGEHDVTINEETGEVRRRGFLEFARRGLRAVFNRRTAVGAGATLVIGALTGGAGLAAWGAFAGGVGGGLAAEAWAMIKGKERRLRDELTRVERDRWYSLKRMAVEFHSAPQQRRHEILSQMVDIYHNQSSDPLTGRRKELKEQLGEELSAQDNRRNVLQLLGGLTGTAYGLYSAIDLARHAGERAAEIAAAHGGTAQQVADAGLNASVEAGKTAFGQVGTDLNTSIHHVYQQGGEWFYLYNGAEAGVAHQAAQDAGQKLTQIYAGHGQWGHLFGNAPWKIYAAATAKALLVTGAMYAAGMTEGGAKERQELQEEDDRRMKASHGMLRESVESLRPAPVEAEYDEPKAGQVVSLKGAPFDRLIDIAGRDHPWNRDWKFVRLTKVEVNPMTKNQELSVEFFQSEADLRTGSTPEGHVISSTAWSAIAAAGSFEDAQRRVTESERRRIESSEFRGFFERARGKEIQLVDKPRPESLRVLVSEQGWPLAGRVDPKAKLQLVDFDTQKNIAELQDQTNGDTLYVSLLGLRAIMKGPKESAKEKSVDEEKDEKKASWKESISELEVLGKPKLKKGDVWIATSDVDGEVAVGSNKGDEETLAADERYVIRALNSKEAKVTVAPVGGGTPVKVSIEAFVSSMEAQQSQVADIFDRKERNGERVPNRKRFERGQEYNFEYTEGTNPDTGPVRYRVEGVDTSWISLIETTPPAGATPKRRRVNPLTLAENGQFL